MALSFLHTADWHLGHVLSRMGARAAESYHWRFEAIYRIYELAVQVDAAWILAAGDIFETGYGNARLIEKTLALLGDAPVPVLLIPGNHDPAGAESIWFHPDWQQGLQRLRNVHPLVTPRQPVERDEATIFPCPLFTKTSRDDPTAWIPEMPRGGERFRIGLAHGSWRGYLGPQMEPAGVLQDPIDNRCAERCGLDYLALGHYHSYTEPHHAAARQRTYYSGSPELTSVADDRGGHVLEVRLAEPGATPQVTPHLAGRLRVENWGQVRLSPHSDLDELQARLQQVQSPADTLLRVEFTGSVTPAARQHLEAWEQKAREVLAVCDSDCTGLMCEPAADDFAAMKLEPLEEQILRLLDNPVPEDELRGQPHGELTAEWSREDEVRRAARTLYYEWLRGGA